MLHNKFFEKKREMIPDRIISIENSGEFQMDLKEMPINSKKGHKYILFLVNLSTKQIAAAPISNKQGTTIVKALKHIMGKRLMINRVRVRSIGVDMGAEFVNKNVKDFLDEHDIELIVHNTVVHKNNTSVIERMISTVTKSIEQDIEKIHYEQGNTSFNDWNTLLNEAVFRINNERLLWFKHGNKNTPLPSYVKPIRNRIFTKQDIMSMKPLVHNDMIPLGETVFVFYSNPVDTLTGTDKRFKWRNKSLKFNPIPRTVTHYLIRQGKPIRFIIDNDPTITYNRHELLAKYELT